MEQKLPRAFDIIGDIACVEIKEGMDEKKTAENILKNQKSIKIVAKKIGITEGIERIQKVEVISGENRTETIHKENGIILKLDINKVFFTPRLSGERLRILKQVKKNEIVADLFAGVGPCSILIAKKSKCRKVIANDINKTAVLYLKENAKLNKVLDKMEITCLDAKKLNIQADRLIMNIPMFSFDFIDLAFRVVEKGIIHFYYFEGEKDRQKFEIIRESAKKLGKKIRIQKKVKCGSYAPGVHRMCADIKVY